MSSAPATAEAAASSSVKRTVIRGSAFEMAGYAGSQAVRLISNLVLTRLLFPEALGLSQMVGTVFYAVHMLSDVGVRQCVIQHPRGEDPSFLGTALTVQAVRGFILGVAVLLMAWPVSVWGFREPQLVPYLIFSALFPIVGGLHSTAVYVLRRRIQLGWVVGLELGTQIVTTAGTIAAAFIWRSPWALLFGTLLSGVAYTIGSYLLPVRVPLRFRFDREAYKALTGFGRWIFGSSAVFLIGARADTFFLGRYMGAATLGVYTNAVMISEAIGVLADRVVASVFYPLFSKQFRDGADGLAAFYYRVRLRLDAVALPTIGFLSGCGSLVVDLLWDARYAEAGWILQLLCIRTATVCLTAPCESCVAGSGYPRFVFLKNLSRTITIVCALPIGWRLGGLYGLVLATALSEIPGLLVLWWKARGLKLFRFDRELLAIGLFLAGHGAGRLLKHFVPVLPWKL
jgi:O-antigen/teichoic acid export membrane protein